MMGDLCPLEDLLEQIEVASDAKLYYVGLASALIVPDICAALEAPDGRATSAGYVRWFDAYVAPKYTVGPDRTPSFHGVDAYMFRCSFLHQGRLQHPNMSYSRILFLEPSDQQMIMHNNVMGDALNIDVRIFCSDVVDGARCWCAHVADSPVVAVNRQFFVQRYANGLAPYIAGIPVIG